MDKVNIPPVVRQAVLDEFYNLKSNVPMIQADIRLAELDVSGHRGRYINTVEQLYQLAAFLDQTNPVNDPEETYIDVVKRVATE